MRRAVRARETRAGLLSCVCESLVRRPVRADQILIDTRDRTAQGTCTSLTRTTGRSGCSRLPRARSVPWTCPLCQRWRPRAAPRSRTSSRRPRRAQWCARARGAESCRGGRRCAAGGRGGGSSLLPFPPSPAQALRASPTSAGRVEVSLDIRLPAGYHYTKGELTTFGTRYLRRSSFKAALVLFHVGMACV